MASTRLLEGLRVRGWRLTPQRRVIAEAMEGEHVHLTADEVLERARALLPEVSLATVYNTLNELVAMGEVQQVDAGSGPTRSTPIPSGTITTWCASAVASCTTFTPLGRSSFNCRNTSDMATAS